MSRMLHSFDGLASVVRTCGVEFTLGAWGGYTDGGTVDVLPLQGVAHDYASGDAGPLVFEINTVRGWMDFQRHLMAKNEQAA